MAVVVVEDCLELNQAQRQWGYSGNIPINSRDSLFPEMPPFSWPSQALGNITASSMSTIRNSNISPDELSLLVSAWCIPAAMCLPKLGVTELLGKVFASSTGLQALPQEKTKMTYSKHMQKKEITKHFMVSVHEIHVESALQEQNPMLWKDPHPGSLHQFILDVSYHICVEALLYLMLHRLFADHLSQNITWIIYLKVNMWILQYITGKCICEVNNLKFSGGKDHYPWGKHIAVHTWQSSSRLP